MRKFPRCARLLLSVVVFSLTSSLAGFAATLAAAPTTINYGNWPVDSGPYQYLTLTNRGSGWVKISQVAISGAFKTYGVTTPINLRSGASTTFMVKFVPKKTGSLTGKLTVVSNAPTVTVPLSGVGLAAGTLTISPSSLSFGNVNVGSTAAKTASLKAGGSTIYVADATTTNPEFTLSGFQLPLIIPAGQSVSVGVNFKPNSSGAASGQIAIVNNASKTPTTVSLSGSGVAAQQHTVSLSWSPSPSAVAGYNLYRGTTAGGPYTKLNGSAIVATSFGDNSVQSGKTYFYVATSLGSAGAESAKSNETRAVVPSP